MLDSKVRIDINNHVEKVAESVNKMKHVIEASTQDDPVDFDFISPLERIKQTKKVVDMSLEAEEEEKEIFKQRNDFLKILKAFITDKEFEFQNGHLTVYKNGSVPISKLSSGGKSN